MGYNIKMPWFETWLAVSLNLYTRACKKFSPSCPSSTSAADLSVKILSPARSPRSVYPVVWSANRTAVPTRTADDYSNIRLGFNTQESVVYSVSKPDSYGTLAERPHRFAQNFYVLGSVEKAFVASPVAALRTGLLREIVGLDRTASSKTSPYRGHSLPAMLEGSLL